MRQVNTCRRAGGFPILLRFAVIVLGLSITNGCAKLSVPGKLVASEVDASTLKLARTSGGRTLVVPSAASLKQGESQQLEAKHYDSGGIERPGTPRWSSSNPAVARVSATGLLVAISPGSARITATLHSLAGSINVTVEGANPSAWERERTLIGPTEPYRAIAASGRTLHVVHGERKLVYFRSQDEGVTWESAVTLWPGAAYLDDPIDAEGDHVHVVYMKDLNWVDDGTKPKLMGDLFMRSSYDNGTTWGPEVRISRGRQSYRVSMHVSGNFIHVVWMDLQSGAKNILYRRSQDGGRTFEPERVVADGSTSLKGTGRPQLALSGDSVHIVYTDGRDNRPACPNEGGIVQPQCPEIYYRRSLDQGTTWDSPVRLTSEPGYAGRPDIAASGNLLVVSYDQAYEAGNQEQHVIRSLDGGNTWLPTQRLTNVPGLSSHSTLAIVGSTVHVAFHDNRGMAPQAIFYRMSLDSGETWQPEQKLSRDNGDIYAVPLMARSLDFLHIIWAGQMPLSATHYRRLAL